MPNYQIPQKFKSIWQKALPYQDTRMDKGHAFIVTIYAKHLCDVEKTDINIVIPAAILHDIGWSKLNEADRMLVFQKDTPKDEYLRVRHAHEKFGVKLASEILNAEKYNPNEITQILEIISEHDTRSGFVNSNEGAMRDADKLWRFDDYGFLNDNQISQISFSDHFKSLENYLEREDFFYFEYSKRLAEEMLDNLKKKYHD